LQTQAFSRQTDNHRLGTVVTIGFPQREDGALAFNRGAELCGAVPNCKSWQSVCYEFQ
jgi:hypothetical protein